MTLANRLGRPMIAAMFVSGGVDQLRNPDEKVGAAADVVDAIEDADIVPVPEDTRDAVRLNGAVQLVAGSLLAINRVPRLASLALAGSLVPTTMAGHRFWEVEDPEARAQQRIHFLKNLAMFGGLVIAASDRDGQPSMGWRARRAAKRATKRAATLRSDSSSAAESISSAADAIGASALEVASTLSDQIERGADAAGPAVDDARGWLSARGSEATDRASAVAASTRTSLGQVFADLSDAVGAARDALAPRLSDLGDRAQTVAADASDRVGSMANSAGTRGRKVLASVGN